MDQRELVYLYGELKALLRPYEAYFDCKIDLDSRYDLWATGDFEVSGKRRKEVFFAGLIIQSNYVGFYFMPVYAEASVKAFFEPELLKCLKGKSCFHIKKWDETLARQIQKALEDGLALYRERGWLSAR